MKTIEKIKIKLSEPDLDVSMYAINILIEKVNELTQVVNDLNYEVGVIHEWKLEKEGI